MCLGFLFVPLIRLVVGTPEKLDMRTKIHYSHILWCNALSISNGRLSPYCLNENPCVTAQRIAVRTWNFKQFSLYHAHFTLTAL